MPIVPIDPTNSSVPETKPHRRYWKLPNKLKLIGISGHAGSGKDTVCEFLYSTYVETYSESMAGPLKVAMAEAFGIPLREFHNPDYKEVINPYWGVSPRMIAQFAGTELFRDQIWKLLPNDQSDFWVRRMWGKLSGLQRGDEDGDYTEGDTVVIPDIRFQEEVDFINDNEGVHIHLIRDSAKGKVGLENHPSESQNFSLKGDRTYVISNNGTLEELYEKVRGVVEANLKLVRHDITNSI